MIKARKDKERRSHPRLENNIPIKISQENGDIVTETGNISRSGIYCRVERQVEPMTKFKVQLLLPIKKGGKDTSKKISCEGIVVRVEPVNNGQYNIAIFFSDITQRDAETIADYVANYLEEARN